MTDTLDISEIIQKFDVSGPVDEERIASAERLLGVKFPPEYRHFLKCYGAALGAGFEVAGVAEIVSGEQPLWDDVVRFTKAMRDCDGKIGMYDDLVAVSSDGMDITFYLRTDKTHAGEVIAMGPGIEKVVATSFNEFMAKISKGDPTQEYN